MPIGECIGIQYDFLGRIEFCQMPHEDRVFLARFEANAVPVAVLEVRHRRVVLLQSSDDLRIEGVLERLGLGEHRFRVGILSVEVCQDLRVAALVVA